MKQLETVVEIVKAVQAGQTKAGDVMRGFLEVAQKHHEDYHALRDLFEDEALEQAREIDELPVERRRELVLCGVPVVVKENVSLKGLPLTAGRPDGAGVVADRDADVAAALRDAGAVIMGRATMDELAYGVTGSNDHTGQALNPWDRERNPGGSSSGPAVAVAAKFAPLGIGTDTGGSVRIPAACCGLVGVRPTRGAVSKRGVAPLSRSLDSVGPLVTTVDDAALVLSVLTGRPELSHYPRPESKPLEGKKLVHLTGEYALGVSEHVAKMVEQVGELFAQSGAAVEAVNEPAIKNGARASGPIIGSEASYAWANELKEHPEWFGESVRDLLTKGMAIKAVRLLRAQDEAAEIVEVIDAMFERGAWAIMLPTTVDVPEVGAGAGNQLRMLALTAPFSLGGWPSMSLPIGLHEGKLPVGLQVVAPRGCEDRLLTLGKVVEQVRPWVRTAPNVV